MKKSTQAERVESRKRAAARWNSSPGGQAAKRRWKESNPKRAWCTYAVSSMRRRAIRKQMSFEVTAQQLEAITPDTCPVFGIEFQFIDSKRQSSNSPSVDRLDSSKGYVLENLCVISMKANVIKNAYTAEDVFKVARWMRDMGL